MLCMLVLEDRFLSKGLSGEISLTRMKISPYKHSHADWLLFCL
jgi:hypothetical protein